MVSSILLLKNFKQLQASFGNEFPRFAAHCVKSSLLFTCSPFGFILGIGSCWFGLGGKGFIECEHTS